MRSQRILPVGKSNQDPKKFDLRQPKCLDGGEVCDIILILNHSAICRNLMQGSVYAEINEKPVEDKQYNDYLIWENEVQINTYPNVEKHYYFNKGAQIGEEANGTGYAIHVVM